MPRWFEFLFWLALTLLSAAFGGMHAPGTWFAGLAKPANFDGGWVFGPGWAVLYTLMAFAAWRVWRRKQHVVPAIMLWFLQLGLLTIWPWIFFDQHRIGWALIDAMALLLAILATTLVFWRIDKAAGVLMAPYLLWVGFASLVVASLYRLNP
jgi:translocator protein